MWLRKIIFGINERFQKGDAWKVFDRLLENESLRSGQIEEIQRDKLIRLIRYAYDHVPFYRETWNKVGVRPRDIRHFDDFREKIPVVSKMDVRDRFDAFVSDAPRPGVYLVETSGTTGYPTTFMRDGVGRSFTMAGRYRGRQWWGVRPVDTEVRFWGRTARFTPSFRVKLRDRLKRFKDGLVGIHYCSTFRVSDEDLEKYRRIVARARPRVTLGFPSAYFIFSKFMRDRGIDFLDLNIPLISYTAESFYAPQRRIVEEVFGKNIGGEYGSVENGVMAFECPHRSYHVMDEDVYLESCRIGDKDDQLVATNLNGYSFPLIRYQTDDVGAISDPICPCGRPLKLLKLRQSRMFDLIRKPDGGYVIPEHIDDAIYLPLVDVKGCRRYRAIQREVGRLEVLLESASPLPKPVLSSIDRNLRHLVGEDVEVEIHRVNRLNVEKSGKFKCILSELSEGGSEG